MVMLVAAMSSDEFVGAGVGAIGEHAVDANGLVFGDSKWRHR